MSARNCHFGLGKLYRRIGKPEQAASSHRRHDDVREMGVRFWPEHAEPEMGDLGA